MKKYLLQAGLEPQATRPELKQNGIRAGGPFPLFYYFLNGSETS